MHLHKWHYLNHQSKKGARDRVCLKCQTHEWRVRHYGEWSGWHNADEWTQITGVIRTTEPEPAHVGEFHGEKKQVILL